MAAPKANFKLGRGLGRLIRTSNSGTWTWQRWNKRLNKWVTTPTNEFNRSKAEQFVYQQAAMRENKPTACRRVQVLFESVSKDYLAARSEGRDCKKLRPTSIKKVQSAINSFKEFLGERYSSLTIDRIDAELLIGFRENEKGRLTANVANRNLKYITAILDFAVDQNLITETPKVKGIPKGSDGNENGNGVTGSAVPTVAEVRLILDAAKTKLVPTGRIKSDGRPIYDRINANDYSDLFAVLCYTGMRIGEAIHLTWSDVDFQNSVILIRTGIKNGEFWQPKTKHGNRRIAIVPKLAEILQRVKATNRKNIWVFETKRGTQLHASNVQMRFRDICDGLGFEKRFTVHSLRKYWASTVAQQGMPWQIMIKMFGHGDFKLILETYYAQNDDARFVAEARKINFGLNGA